MRVVTNTSPRRIKIRMRMGSAMGIAKNTKGGTKISGETPTEVSIFEVKDVSDH